MSSDLIVANEERKAKQVRQGRRLQVHVPRDGWRQLRRLYLEPQVAPERETCIPGIE
jgi:hypothetical protein